MNHEIFRNERKGPNDFSRSFNCFQCDSFSSNVIRIPKTGLLICKTCLNNLIIALDKDMQQIFEDDFNMRIQEENQAKGELK